jgi:Cryptococcal mannosyltransferase 1
MQSEQQSVLSTFSTSWVVPPFSKFACYRNTACHAYRSITPIRSKPGRVNPGNERIFIAASIFDPSGDLAQGAWENSVLGLIDLLGPANVFLSTYENDAGPIAKRSLEKFGKDIESEHQIIFENQLDLNGLPRTQLPDGTKQIKRIAYLAEVRNRALRLLNSSDIKFDKLLYLNDVIFDPVNAAQLLFATNARSNEAQYRAACSLDFINPFKFYDTFASGNLEGYSMKLSESPLSKITRSHATLTDHHIQ